MLALELNFEDGTRRLFEAALPVSVGRAAECDLRLKTWRVGKHHAKFIENSAGILIEDKGTLSGTFVNGHRVTRFGPLKLTDEIIIGPCLIRLLKPGDPPLRSYDDAGGAPAASMPFHLDEAHPSAVRLSTAIVSSASDDLVASDGRVEAAAGCHGEHKVSSNSDVTDDAGAGSCGSDNAESDVYAGHCRQLHGALLEALDLRRRDIAAMSDAALRAEATQVLSDILTNDKTLPADLNHDRLIQRVVDEAVGLGPLEPLLADNSVSEIMVNRHDEIFIESAGRLHRHDGSFSSEQAVMGIIERIVSPLGRRIDESSPMVDARLRDGSRVNAVIPPIALRGASITIRKFPATRPKMADLLRVGALDENISRFLMACVVQKKNIVVSGGTGSGKTTLLNILSSCIPRDERIVTIEDAAELQLDHEHLVSLEARPANLEGRGAILIRDLVRNALRMRPDRIVVGECRGAEAFDMLAAMNTGHEGSLTTLHANSPRDALNRLETMILMAGMDLPLLAVREHVASSVDIIVQQARMSSGRRVITSVVQVTGQESGRIQLQELFQFDAGPPPVFSGCGIWPDGLQRDDGILSMDVFNARSETHASAAIW